MLNPWSVARSNADNIALGEVSTTAKASRQLRAADRASLRVPHQHVEKLAENLRRYDDPCLWKVPQQIERGRLSVGAVDAFGVGKDVGVERRSQPSFS